jgi:hypothetical protein
MKILISATAIALGLALAGPAFAGDVSKATTKADCEKAGGMWNAQSNSCAKKGGGGY